MLVLTAISLLVMTPFAYAAEQSFYSATRGSSCTDRSRDGFNLWRCAGPGGYDVEYADEGNIAGIAIWIPSKQRRPGANINWRGGGRVFGEKLEWRMVAEKPVAAILRIWRTETSASGREYEVEELLIMRLSPTDACRIASINARQAHANQIAQKIADDAAGRPCTTLP